MPKNKKNAGFNTPFAGLSKRAKPAKAPAPLSPPTKPKRVQPAAPAEPRDDDNLFARAVSDVKPIAKDNRRMTPPPTHESDQLAQVELESLVQSTDPWALEIDDFRSHGRAPGVSRKILRQLYDGQFAPAQKLDLHRLRKQDAYTKLQRFIANARRDGHRCVLVIPGQGLHSSDGIGVLREALPQWLSTAPIAAHTLAFTTADARHGGAGAFLVLLRRPPTPKPTHS